MAFVAVPVAINVTYGLVPEGIYGKMIKKGLLFIIEIVIK